MTKTILLTGATDGIGFEAAKRFITQGHTVLIHGRNPDKLVRTKAALSALAGAGPIETCKADLSNLLEVEAMAQTIIDTHASLDIVINNAGVFKTSHPTTANGMDVRFVVNTLAPYHLTQKLLPIMPKDGRVVNLSSAAQAPVDLAALQGKVSLGDNPAYAQSKLAITMWSNHLARTLPDGPVIVSVNPASFIGTKMVKEAYGMEGKDLSIGADIIVRAALSDEFTNASGCYFDNDNGRFADPHPDALDTDKNAKLVEIIEDLIENS